MSEVIPTKHMKKSLYNQKEAKNEEQQNIDINEKITKELLHLPPEEIVPMLEKNVNDKYFNRMPMLIEHMLQFKSTFIHIKTILDIEHEILKIFSPEWDNEESIKKIFKMIYPNQANIHNKKAALKHLQNIYEFASIPKDIKDSLTKPNFEDISQLTNLYNKLIEANNEYLSNDIPQILINMKQCCKQKKTLLEKLLLNFVSNFSTQFIHQLLRDIPQIIKYKNENFNNEENKNNSRLKEIISKNIILQILNPYINFINFAKNFHPDSYKYIVEEYSHCAKKLIDYEVLGDVGMENIELKKFLGNEQLDTQLYILDFGSDESPRTLFLQNFIKITKKLIDRIQIEEKTFNEYWEIEKAKHEMISSHLSKEFDDYIDNISLLGPFYALKAYSIIKMAFGNDFTEIIEYSKQKWEKHIEYYKSYIEKTNNVQNHKLTTSKTVPSLIIQFVTKCIGVDEDILKKNAESLINAMLNKIITFNDSKMSTLKKNIFNVINVYTFLKTFNKKNNLNVGILKNSYEHIIETQKNVHSLFIKELVSHYMSNVWTFFEQINIWKQNKYFYIDLIRIQPTHTIQKFDKLNENLPNLTMKSISKCKDCIKKNFKWKILRKELKKQLHLYLELKIDEWNDVSIKFYKTELKLSKSKIDLLFNKINLQQV